MSLLALPLLLAAGPEETTLRFKSMPPLWVVIMVIIPAVIGIVWWTYRREGASATTRAKRVLAGLRSAAIILILMLLFQPYAETSVKKLVKSHLVVLVDTSASMEFVDAYANPEKRQATRGVANLGLVQPSTVARLELVKGTLTNPNLDLLNKLAKRFHLHIYTFDVDTTLLFSGSEALEDKEQQTSLTDRIHGLRGTGAFTFLGDAVSDVLDDFRLRDEPLAGVVVLTDGRQSVTAGATGPVDAARKAAGAQPSVPLYLVGIGDPDLPRNIHVSNLKAREVVLRGEEVLFQFAVSHMGFVGEPVTAELLSMDEDGRVEEELDLRGAATVLGEEGEEITLRVSHRFERPGSYALRIGIPVMEGEKIENDNFITHHLRVVDKKIKVLYVEGYPRWEYRFLKNALIRDHETILAHVVNLDADPSAVQPYSPGWRPIQHFPEKKEDLYEYAVVIFGDVDWQRLVPPSEPNHEERSKAVLENLREFVEDGGGFIMIAGPYNSPRSYGGTDLRYVLPVVVNPEEAIRASQDTARSFNLVLTEEGREHPIMMLEDDPVVSRQIWEQDKFSAQFWYFPVERAKSTATVLATHPGEYSHNRNKFGPHVIMATMPYKAGRSLYIGVDELWRLRWAFGDRYHYRFYGEAIRLLATHKLLGGNLRFKIFTDQETYFVGDQVSIEAEVYDHDFKPLTAETQTITVRTPDGDEQEILMVLDPSEPGRYIHTLTVFEEGTYLLHGDAGDGDEERPEKLFKVEYSTEEMKNPLINLELMNRMAVESSGEALPLYQIGKLPETIPPRSVYISSEVRSEDLWDDSWVLFVFTALLAAEWLIRKRYRLL
jgi:hypothetical protein